MRALFDYVSVAHYEYKVGGTNGRKPVRDHKRRLAVGQFVKGFLNFHFGARVYVRRGFVENKHGRKTEHYSRYRDKLLLPLRKPFFADYGIVPFGKSGYKPVTMRAPARAFYLFVRRVGLAYRHVVSDARLSYPRLLQTHTDVLS